MGLTFAKDGRTLVTSTTGGHITLWRMPEGTKLGSFPSEQYGWGAHSSFAATPDLSLAAYGLEEGRFRVIDLRDGKELWTVVASKQYLTALAFSPDGKTLASAGGYGESEIRLWEVATGKEIGRLEGHKAWVGSLVFWPDGKKLASSSADQTIRTWDVSSRKSLDVLSGHRLEVWRLALQPDNKTLVSGAKDGTVCFWDTSVTHLHQAGITLPVALVVNWNFAADGRSVLTLDKQGQLAQWAGADFQQKEALLELGKDVSAPLFSKDGHFLAAGFTNEVLQIWNVSRRVRQLLTNTFGPVTPVSFLADGKNLITISQSGNLLHEWDLPTGLQIQSWPLPAGIQPWGSGAGEGRSPTTPDERSLMAIGGEGDVVFRNLVDGSQTKLKLDGREFDGGCFSPDGKVFAIASSLGYARVWDTANWRPVATLGGFLKGVHSVGFSMDGKRLATGSGDQEAVKLWDTESWQDVFTLEGQGTGYIGVGFSPDGNTLVWGNQTGVLQLWRAPTWEEINAAEAKEKAESNRH
jgi:WD40 repeat protein